MVFIIRVSFIHVPKVKRIQMKAKCKLFTNELTSYKISLYSSISSCLVWDYVDPQRVGHDWATELSWTDVDLKLTQSKAGTPKKRILPQISVMLYCDCAAKYDYHLDFTLFWRRKWQPTPVVLPGESHGQRSLVGYSPWGLKESDTTERLTQHTCWSLCGRLSDIVRQYNGNQF